MTERELLTAFVELEPATVLEANRLDKVARFFRNSPDMETRISPVLITFALVCLALGAKRASGQSRAGRWLSRQQHSRRDKTLC